ncbi:hypothetical protein C8R43DRAFT_153306 [Mycena crocata]|nr:hypothetical protein C8R43DRAFT_153306 [Mycena crocata]
MKSHKDEWLQVTEQIHEVLCAIISLYPDAETDGVVPSGLLYDIGRFTETLQKLYTCLKTQQEMGKLKRLFKHLQNVSQLETCKAELQESRDIFRVHVGQMTISGIARMEKTAADLHEDLLALLAAHPDLTYSERASTVTGRLSGSASMHSSGSLLMLPPSPGIFYGREYEIQQVVDTLKQESPRLAILGTGGIGKTTLATAALHHGDIVHKYPQRYFISCHSATTSTDLVEVIASHVGVDKGPNLARRIASHLKFNSICLLVLDNFETPWEAARREVEEILSLLTEIPHLALMLTMRGAQHPSKVQWTHPFLEPLQPLSDAAALQIFSDITDETHDERSLKQVLECTGNLPLAVSLMASVVAHEGCDEALARWETQRTRLLSTGTDRRSNLDISIEISFTSSRMNASAQQLLSVLAMLPDGLTDSDLLQSTLPMTNILASKSTLIGTSLAYVDAKGRLKALVPIREHVLAFHAPSADLKLALREHFYKILDLWSKFDHLQLGSIVSAIATNLGNMNSTFRDALEMPNAEDTIPTFESILHLNRFYVNTRHASVPLMLALSDKVVNWKTHPIYGRYLVELFYSAMDSPIQDAETQINAGNQYFEHADALKAANWYHALSFYHRYQTLDVRQALEKSRTALKLADSIGHPTTVGQKALHDISLILTNGGNQVEGQIHAERSLDYAKYLGDIHGQAKALAVQAFCCLTSCDFRRNRDLCKSARELLDIIGLKGSSTDLQLMATEAAVHYMKTEYAEARQIYASVIDGHPPGQAPSHRITLSHINLAAIDVMLGAESGTIRQHLDIALHHLTTTISYPRGLIIRDMASAELDLREGNTTEARLKFLRCFSSGFSEEGTAVCLTQLADVGHQMHDVETTMRWSGIFLAFALKNKNKLSTMHALRCLGKIMVAQGDDATAISLFVIALNAFTFMDVHRWRGECMVQMGDIYLRKGDQQKSLALYTTAMPLFQRSSQIKDVETVNEKISAVNAHVAEESAKLFAQLETIHPPSEGVILHQELSLGADMPSARQDQRSEPMVG